MRKVLGVFLGFSWIGLALVSASASAKKSVGRFPAAADQGQSEKISLKCSPPGGGFAGISGSVSGHLVLTLSENGSRNAEGKVDVTIGGSTATPLLRKRGLSVRGRYDDIVTPYALVAANEVEDLVIYMNFSDGPGSYIEYQGRIFPMRCEKESR